MYHSGEKWVINMFIGQYHHNLDDKGRLTIPSKIRYELKDNFIVTRGLDGCLFIYPNSTWQNIMSKYENLPNTKDTRNFMRFFLSSASITNVDKQGRINIPEILLNYADITKECVIIGVGDRVEIWSLNHWNNFIKENENNLSKIADNIFSNI